MSHDSETALPRPDAALAALVDAAFPRWHNARANEVVTAWLVAQWATTVDEVRSLSDAHWALLPGVLATTLRDALDTMESPRRGRDSHMRPDPERPAVRSYVPLMEPGVAATLRDAIASLDDASPRTRPTMGVRDPATDEGATMNPAAIEIPAEFTHALAALAAYEPTVTAPTELLNTAIRLAPVHVLTSEGDVKVIVDTANRMRLGQTLAWMREGAKGDVGPLGSWFRIARLASFMGERTEVDPCDLPHPGAELENGLNVSTGQSWACISAPLRGFARWYAQKNSHEPARFLRELPNLLAPAGKPVCTDVEALPSRNPTLGLDVKFYMEEVQADPGLPQSLYEANYPLRRVTLRPHAARVGAETTAPVASAPTQAAPPAAKPRGARVIRAVVASKDHLDVLAMVLDRLYPSTASSPRMLAVGGPRLAALTIRLAVEGAVVPSSRALWRRVVEEALASDQGDPLGAMLLAALDDHPNDAGLADIVSHIAH